MVIATQSPRTVCAGVTSGSALAVGKRHKRYSLVTCRAGHITEPFFTEMIPERCSERVFERMRPDWEPGLRGIHTFSHRPALTVTDAMKEVPRSRLWARLSVLKVRLN